MKPNDSKILGQIRPYLRIMAVFFLASSLILVLASLLLEPVRIFLAVPLEFIAWVFKSLYLLIPRHVSWVIFLVLAYLIAIHSLQSKAKEPENEKAHVPELYGEPQIARTARYITLSYRPFYRHRLNHLVTEIAVRAFSFRLQATQQQVRLLLSKDSLDLPDEILDYIKAGLPPWPTQAARRSNFLSRWALSKQEQAKAVVEVEKALDFLEAYLEVPREY